jgi:pyruvate/2-oxoglutarate dehydrogenase complex dihydrolipoamide acyltransferase (E2) component
VHDVIIPKMGMSSNEVDVLDWHVNVGDEVAVGTPLLDVESEKAVLTVESEVVGVVTEIMVPKGSETTVGSVVCRIRPV